MEERAPGTRQGDIRQEHIREAKSAEIREAELYRQIGQLKVEVDWLKKKSAEINGL